MTVGLARARHRVIVGKVWATESPKTGKNSAVLGVNLH